MNRIKLLILEENELLRKGFVEMLKKHPKLEVEAGSGTENFFDEIIDRFNPNVILLNSGLLSRNSLLLVENVISRYPDVKIVVMGLSISESEIIQFMEAGATGFILKDSTVLEFVKTIIIATWGDHVIPAHNSDLLLSRLVNLAKEKGKAGRIELAEITELELQLLKYQSEGLSNKEIGIKLQISSKRVKTHIHNIKQKLYLFTLLDPAASD